MSAMTGGTTLPLNARQAEVAALVAEGLTDEAIGARLGLSAGRIRNICSEIYRLVPACQTGNPRVKLAIWQRARASQEGS